MHIAPRIVTYRGHIAVYLPRIAGVPELRVWFCFIRLLTAVRRSSMSASSSSSMRWMRFFSSGRPLQWVLICWMRWISSSSRLLLVSSSSESLEPIWPARTCRLCPIWNGGEKQYDMRKLLVSTSYCSKSTYCFHIVLILLHIVLILLSTEMPIFLALYSQNMCQYEPINMSVPLGASICARVPAYINITSI